MSPFKLYDVDKHDMVNGGIVKKQAILLSLKSILIISPGS